MRLELHLQGEEGACLRLVRQLLKRLGRDHGIAVAIARPIPRGALSAREALDLAEPLLGAALRVLATAGVHDTAPLALEAAGLVRRASIVAGLAEAAPARAAPSNAAESGTETR